MLIHDKKTVNRKNTNCHTNFVFSDQCVDTLEMARIYRTNASLLLVLLTVICIGMADKPPVQCRDPNLGNHAHSYKMKERKFLMIGGLGAGIGNFLVFYPAAYYFAALTGRDILVLDGSLIDEMCKVLECGFPRVGDMKSAFPSIVNDHSVQHSRGAKVYDFHRHFSGEAVINEQFVTAHGYKYMSGWYSNIHRAEECLHQITGWNSYHDFHPVL